MTRLVRSKVQILQLNNHFFEFVNQIGAAKNNQNKLTFTDTFDYKKENRSSAGCKVLA